MHLLNTERKFTPSMTEFLHRGNMDSTNKGGLKMSKRHLNIILTEDEYQRMKKVLHAHGSISMIVRTLLMKFVRQQEAKDKEEK